MNHFNFTQKEYEHFLSMIPKEFYQELAANGEERTPEERAKQIDEMKKQMDTWKEELSVDKKELVEKLSTIEKEKSLVNTINEEIYLNNRFSEKGIPDKRKEEITKIDELLTRAPKLESTTFIQKPISDFAELLSEFDSDQPSTKPKQEEAVKEALSKLDENQAIKELGYLTGKLEKESSLQESYLEIKIPEGERGIFFGTSEATNLLFNRDMVLYITERSEIKNEKGDWITKLKGELHTSQPIDFQDNKLAAEKWMAPLTAELGKAPKEERTALERYTGGKAYDFNEKLRSGKELKDSEKKMAEQIDSIIKRVQLSSPTTVYRRVDASQFGYKEGAESLRENNNTLKASVVKEIQEKIKTDTTFHNLTYTSTSMSKDPDPTYDGKSRPIILKITLPTNANAAFIGRESKFPNQQEVLLPRNSTFHYEKASVIKDTIQGKTYESLMIETSMQLPKNGAF